MSKSIAIMQPTYLPWLGYLAMIEKVDQFVFLDNVQFEHRSWQQRNRIKAESGAMWLTISVKQKGVSDQKIEEVLCADLQKDYKKHLKSIIHHYAKSKYYKKFYEALEHVIEAAAIEANGYLAHFNISIIKFLCGYAGIEKEFVLSSSLNLTGSKDELLAKICEKLDGRLYVSAPGSKGYLEGSQAFKDRAINIAYHEYLHPQYPQLFGHFVEGMSCVDAFFNVEQANLKTLIMSGCK